MRGYWLGLMAVAAAILASCTQPSVGSREPLFTEADGAGGPKLRDGWWIAELSPCRFRPEKATKHWPDCASQQLLVRGASLLSYDPDKGWATTYPTIVNGEPLILQDRDRNAEQSRYQFAVLGKPKFDADSRLIAFEEGLLPCGPFRPWKPEMKAKADWDNHLKRRLTDPDDHVTTTEQNPPWPDVGDEWEAYPGFVWGDGYECWAKAPGDVRLAAQSFRNWIDVAERSMDQAAANPKSYEADRKAAGYSRRKGRQFLQEERGRLFWYRIPMRWVRDERPDDFVKPSPDLGAA